MCGIAGVINLKSKLSPAETRALAGLMADAIRHRGPDDHGVWQDDKNYCSFSHRRLTVIDKTLGGRQPMVLPKGSCLVFNGEIYNYQTLRAELERDQVVFSSASDTEVLLRGLDRYGISFVDRLDGMFAFAYFQAATGDVYLARDRFGEKPLYYAQQGGLLTFASELNALTLQPNFDASITLAGIATYLALQYLPAPQTIYRNAAKLPPGHVACLRPNGELTIKRTFRFMTSSVKQSQRSLDDLANELEQILITTIRARMISDVPLGAFLSSGLDSSTVVAIATQQLRVPIETFSMGFSQSRKSEHVMAREIAEHLGSTHHEFMPTFDALEIGEHIAKRLDEPNGDNSCLPTFLLAQHAKPFVTVALSGDGGDEMFGGYNRYFDMLREEEDSTHAGRPWAAGEAYYGSRILILSERVLGLFLGDVPTETTDWLRAHKHVMTEDTKPLINRMREADAAEYLPGAVLAKVDRMTMQHALEIRSPFLGNDVARFASGLAASDCYENGIGKRVLRCLASRYMPGEWFDRPKLGFSLALEDWDGAALSRATSALLLSDDCRLQEWVSRERLAAFCRFHEITPAAHHLWSVYILENWLRHHAATPAAPLTC